MSLTSKLTFGASCVFTVSVIAYVHLKQDLDKERLQAGVVRDIEAQQRRKIENVFNLQKQSDLTRHLESIQQLQNPNNEPK